MTIIIPHQFASMLSCPIKISIYLFKISVWDKNPKRKLGLPLWCQLTKAPKLSWDIELSTFFDGQPIQCHTLIRDILWTPHFCTPLRNFWCLYYRWPKFVPFRQFWINKLKSEVQLTIMCILGENCIIVGPISSMDLPWSHFLVRSLSHHSLLIMIFPMFGSQKSDDWVKRYDFDYGSHKKPKYFYGFRNLLGFFNAI